MQLQEVSDQWHSNENYPAKARNCFGLRTTLGDNDLRYKGQEQMRKPMLAYLFHLAIATFGVPWFTLLSSGLAYSLVGHALTSAANPQQFYSDHLFSMAAITGLWLAYLLGDTLPSKCALWVWIPSALGFVARILSWRAAGSVLFHSAIIEHFFATDCQIQNWREPAFSSSCADKLFLTPVVVGSLAYSAGAAIHRAVQHRRSGATNSTGRVSTTLLLVTTRPRAFVAVAVTGWVLAIDLHSQMTGTLSAGQWLFSGNFPTWAVVAINIAVWGLFLQVGVALALGSLRKDEKVLLGAFIWGAMFTPVRALLPGVTSSVHVVQTLLRLGAFLAALSILVSFWNDRVSDAT
jgi:hypothetical protein